MGSYRSAIVAPARRYMRRGPDGLLSPLIDSDLQADLIAGRLREPAVGRYPAPFGGDDLRIILEVEEGGPRVDAARGWLTNFGIEAFLSTLMPCVVHLTPMAAAFAFAGAKISNSSFRYATNGVCDSTRAYLPACYSSLRRHDPLTPPGFVSDAFYKAGIEELYIPFNQNGNHWVLLVVTYALRRLEVYDSLERVKSDAETWRRMLRGIVQPAAQDAEWQLII